MVSITRRLSSEILIEYLLRFRKKFTSIISRALSYRSLDSPAHIWICKTMGEEPIAAIIV